MPTPRLPCPSALALALAALSALAALAHAAPLPERAAPPTFTDADLEPFFPDARAALVGARPNPTPGAAAAAGTSSAASADAPAEFRWSELIDADALDTEVKRIAARLGEPLASPAAFKAGGNQLCRGEFAMLAVLFGVIADYDGDARWQRDAAVLRDACARTSANCKTASDQTYADAVRRRDELADVIRGGRLGGEAPPLDRWSTLADRKLLMQRMQRAMQEGFTPRLGAAPTFAKAAVDVRQEAQVLALLAELIRRADYEFHDDDTFVEYAQELGGGALQLSHAAADGNYEAARAAAGRIGQACAACHDGYRP
jgi:hypothetical protein